MSQQFAAFQKHLSLGKVIRLYERVFEDQVCEKLKDLSIKHRSAFSRELVTVVLDDSVFKQWLSSFKLGTSAEACYGKFFSGQTRSSVYGFRMLCLGIQIDSVFYPLYFEYIRPKSVDKSVSVKSDALNKAKKLVKRFGALKQKLAKQGHELPELCLSCDSGYSDMDLAKECAQQGLVYLSVPKKNHLFEIGGKKIKLSDWIKESYLSLEKAHLEAGQESVQGPAPFIHRFRAKYCCKGVEVTLIAFRLKGSKRVTIVYTRHKTIFKKTMRRHWFQRTYIEQFFKLLKHVLKIQETRTRDKRGFSLKLWRFAWMALELQKMLCYIRKRSKYFKNKGFIYIQRLMRKDEELTLLLQKMIQTKC